MNAMSVITSILGIASSIPAVGQVIAAVLGGLAALQTIVTALVGAWHGVVSGITALSALPGLSGLQNLAKSLQADSATVDADSNQLISWIERFSAIPVPQTTATAAVAAQKSPTA